LVVRIGGCFGKVKEWKELFFLTFLKKK
jgi:hypothetical protein